NRSTGLGPDLLRVLADLEGLGVAVGVIVYGGLELRALPMRVAGDRAADAFELDRQHGVAQRLAADIGDALRIGLGDLLDRLEGELGGVIGVGVIARDRRLAVGLLVGLDEFRIALAHGVGRDVRVGDAIPDDGAARRLDDVGRHLS